MGAVNPGCFRRNSSIKDKQSKIHSGAVRPDGLQDVLRRPVALE